MNPHVWREPRALRRIGAACALAGTVLLAGCASMSPEECRTADWYERGLRDGADGRPRAHFDAHVQACGQVGIQPDMGRYMQGRGKGIEHFCTPGNAADYGARGGYYTRGTCPVALEGAFERDYRLGRAVYDARQEVNRVANRQRDRERELDRVAERQRAKHRELDRARDDDTRRRLRDELRRLDREANDTRERLRRELRRLDREADDARAAVRRAERRLDRERQY